MEYLWKDYYQQVAELMRSLYDRRFSAINHISIIDIKD